MDVNAGVQRIIAEQLDLSPEKVVPDSQLADDLGADSLDLVELTMALEEEFNVEIPDDEVEDVLGMSSTVGDVAEYITRKLDAQD